MRTGRRRGRGRRPDDACERPSPSGCQVSPGEPALVPARPVDHPLSGPSPSARSCTPDSSSSGSSSMVGRRRAGTGCAARLRHLQQRPPAPAPRAGRDKDARLPAGRGRGRREASAAAVGAGASSAAEAEGLEQDGDAVLPTESAGGERLHSRPSAGRQHADRPIGESDAQAVRKPVGVAGSLKAISPEDPRDAAAGAQTRAADVPPQESKKYQPSGPDHPGSLAGLRSVAQNRGAHHAASARPAVKRRSSRRGGWLSDAPERPPATRRARQPAEASRAPRRAAARRTHRATGRSSARRVI